MSFIIKAAVEALRAVPIVNASIDGDNVVYHRDVNIGVAVALDWGLIVPVIKTADERESAGHQQGGGRSGQPRARETAQAGRRHGRYVHDHESRCLRRALRHADHQPAASGDSRRRQVEKRPVVIDDAIAIRPMAYLTLGYDHRLIDGAVADEFMSHLKHRLENWA